MNSNRMAGRYGRAALLVAAFAGVCGSGLVRAQDAPPQPAMHGHMDGMGMGAHGRWWDDPTVASQISLTADQKAKLETLMQQDRPKLIDMHAALQKEEAALEPLMAAATPDEAKIESQIDRVAQARAELEKTHARVLLGMRQVLTPDQWSKLQAMHGAGMHGGHGMRGNHGPAEGAAPPPPPSE